uniref:Wsv306-like protein n=1 Tax=Trachysalambria curvirostris nimavirus TaxID=2984282 RepID=A0A9C7BIT3_9VIRU|nr:MAG: wsv306-like protein [Trachysalambria curvirostris nimavirus]
MANSIHHWVIDKSDCDVYDVYCETNRDCGASCKTLHSEDGREIIRFVCNKESGRCNRLVLSARSVAKAAEDLARIKKHLSDFREVPDTFLWFIEHDDGRLFVSKRAAYYDTLALTIGGLGDINDLALDIKKRIATTLRSRLYRKLKSLGGDLTRDERQRALKWINDITVEAEDYEYDRLDSVRNPTVSLSALLKQVTGNYKYDSLHPQATIDDTFSIDIKEEGGDNDGNGEEQEEPQSVSATSSLTPEDRPEIEPRLSLITLGGARKESLRRSIAGESGMVSEAQPTEYLCNEEMHAGRAEAIYMDENSKELVAVCTCTYPEYLVGPTCHQRTYRYVIDYEKWSKTGYPEFLTDPVRHFKKAEDVCKGLGNNTLAVYDSRHRAFLCAPVAEIVKTALTYRGSHEPCLIIEHDVNNPNNAPSKGFGVNWPYVNLLERISLPSPLLYAKQGEPTD